MYKNIIFDFYGSLVDIKTDEKADFVWRKLSLFMTYHKAAYTSDELRSAYDRILKKQISRHNKEEYPEIDITDVFYKLYMDKGVKVKPKMAKCTALMFRTLTTEYIQVYEGVEDVLKELKKNGSKIYLLSNAQEVYVTAELKMLGLKQYFDGIYISSDYHVSKPNPKFLDTLIAKEKLDKKTTVMVGNEYGTDIKGAKKAGIDSLFIMTETSDKKAKKEEATYSIDDGNHKKIIKVLSKG